MTVLFGIPLLVGIVLMLGWVAATGVASTVDGWEKVDPEIRFGTTGRFILAGAIGFGMAGISALYAGWPSAVALGAGLIGAAGLIGISVWLGPESDH